MSLELDLDPDLDSVRVGSGPGHTASGHPGMPRCGRDHNALCVHDYEMSLSGVSLVELDRTSSSPVSFLRG